jgi:uncharacterized membrane protein YfcA
MTALGYVLVGLVAGSVSASLGVGGGVIFVPALVIFFSFDQHIAQGTSLAVIVPTAIVGAWVHARAGRVVWRYALPLGIAGVAGGVIGGTIALSLGDTVLRRLFAAMLVFTALRMLRASRRAGVTPPRA